MKLQPPRYYVRRLIPKDSSIPAIVFPDATLIPTSPHTAKIFVIDEKRPLDGPVDQIDYTQPTVEIASIVYTISLVAIGEEKIESGVAEPIMAGYSDHFDEVFEHPFK